MDRQADRAPGVGDAARDRLADPPCGVRGELEALAPVELLDGVHQAEVALLDEIEQGQSRRLVLLGDRHDQAQVRLDELALGLFALAGGAAQFALACRCDGLAALVERGDRLVARLDRLRESYLVLLGEQGVLPDIGEVETDEVFVVSFDAIFCHRQLLLCMSDAGPRLPKRRSFRRWYSQGVTRRRRSRQGESTT